MSQRRFTALLATAAGLAGAGLLNQAPKKAEATFWPGAGPNGWDEVDNGLWVAGGFSCAGFLGVGTSNPTSHITISNSGNSFLAFQVSGQNKGMIGYQWTAAPYGLGFYELTASPYWPRLLIASNTGYVGIATNSPAEQLDVAGNVRASGNVTANGNVGIGTGAPTRQLSINHAADAYLSFNVAGAEKGVIGFETTGGSSARGFVIWDTSATQYRMVIPSSGNVGIGTLAPTAKLDVNGTIRAAGTITVNGQNGLDPFGVAVKAYYSP